MTIITIHKYLFCIKKIIIVYVIDINGTFLLIIWLAVFHLIETKA